ncbi:MAG: hypothetical protein ACTSR2_00110 [Candidatus Hodarchaeales archaeon]
MKRKLKDKIIKVESIKKFNVYTDLGISDPGDLKYLENVEIYDTWDQLKQSFADFVQRIYGLSDFVMKYFDMDSYLYDGILEHDFEIYYLEFTCQYVIIYQ